MLAPITLALLVGLFACFVCAKPASALPSGFSDAKVVDVSQPTALAFTPDGRMLVTSKPGQLHVFDQGGNPLASPVLNLGPEVCDNSERGLLGVAVDPRFEEVGHNYVYLYYTVKVGPTCDESRDEDNCVSRFKMNDNTVDESTEEVLIDKIRSPHGNHNGGTLKFGKDGNLYVSVGDGGCSYAASTRCQYENDASRHRHVLLGKILRIKPDGNIPTDNPYYADPDSERCHVTGRTEIGKNCQETFVRGLRNPFRKAFDPDTPGTTTRLFINDVGGQRWEEIDQAKVGTQDDGNDYGWNLCEGRHDNPYRGGRVNCSGSTYTGPIHEYSHRTGCESITGGAFVPDGLWPAKYDDAYLFGDFVCGKIFSLKPVDGGFRREVFEGGLGGRSAVAMTFGPYSAGKA
ncbi:MAG: PQQ-dependent sugar dehydrogenase, partial [Actinomycetota bacterium]|nr:PQQ-dependent sugar dehydrogenase [Actinomycetota bacterium]